MARTYEATTKDGEDSLAIRAVWLHYVGGLTQSQVAKKLGVPNVKAHRLIAKAVADGALKVSIDGDIVECIRYENQLAERYQLEICDVAPDLEELGIPFRALGMAGASRLLRWIESGDYPTIGIGHGRTLVQAVRTMHRTSAKKLKFVSLMGSFTRNYSANPHDVMHLLAEKTEAQSLVLPVPFFANSEEDREVLLAQRGVSEIFALAENAPLKLVGIGNVDPNMQLVNSGMIEYSEIESIKDAGAVSEMLGNFYDEDGQQIETFLNDRTLSVRLNDSFDGQVVALAGGPEKIASIRSVLKSGRLSGLITDERTARALLD